MLKRLKKAVKLIILYLTQYIQNVQFQLKLRVYLFLHTTSSKCGILHLQNISIWTRHISSTK